SARAGTCPGRPPPRQHARTPTPGRAARDQKQNHGATSPAATPRPAARRLIRQLATTTGAQMAYAEKRGNFWRARWRAPGGTVPSKPGFKTRKAAEDYGRDQEAAIRAGTYVEPHARQITLSEWVNQWYPALDLEQS